VTGDCLAAQRVQGRKEDTDTTASFYANTFACLYSVSMTGRGRARRLGLTILDKVAELTSYVVNSF
jgi:hypothetical protein